MPDPDPGPKPKSHAAVGNARRLGRLEEPVASKDIDSAKPAVPPKERRWRLDKPPEKEGPKNEEPSLPLKNGGERMEVRKLRAFEQHVRRLFERHPEHFRALQELIEGRNKEVSELYIRDLRAWRYLDLNLSPLPDVKAIIKAAYRDTPDGHCLVDPIEVKSDTDVKNAEQLIAKQEVRFNRNILKWIDGLKGREDDNNDKKGKDRLR